MEWGVLVKRTEKNKTIETDRFLLWLLRKRSTPTPSNVWESPRTHTHPHTHTPFRWMWLTTTAQKWWDPSVHFYDFHSSLRNIQKLMATQRVSELQIRARLVKQRHKLRGGGLWKAGCRSCQDGGSEGMKHRCLIMLQTLLGRTELALRIYLKTLMALPYVGKPSQREKRPLTWWRTEEAKQRDKKKTKKGFSATDFSLKLAHKLRPVVAPLETEETEGVSQKSCDNTWA